jgi:hypothetical protein
MPDDASPDDATLASIVPFFVGGTVGGEGVAESAASTEAAVRTTRSSMNSASSAPGVS